MGAKIMDGHAVGKAVKAIRTEARRLGLRVVAGKDRPEARDRWLYISDPDSYWYLYVTYDPTGRLPLRIAGEAVTLRDALGEVRQLREAVDELKRYFEDHK